MNKQEIKSNATKKKITETYLDLYASKDISKITIKEIKNHLTPHLVSNLGLNRFPTRLRIH